MPALVALLINLLRTMLFIHAGKILVGILGFFGLQIVTYKYGIEPAIDYIESLMSQGPGGDFGTAAIQWLGVLKLDVAVSMMLSTYLIVQGIKSAKTFLGKVST